MKPEGQMLHSHLRHHLTQTSSSFKCPIILSLFNRKQILSGSSTVNHRLSRIRAELLHYRMPWMPDEYSSYSCIWCFVKVCFTNDDLALVSRYFWPDTLLLSSNTLATLRFSRFWNLAVHLEIAGWYISPCRISYLHSQLQNKSCSMYVRNTCTCASFSSPVVSPTG